MISSVKDYIIAGLAVALIAGAIAGVVLKAKLSAAKSNLEVSQMRETRLQEEVGKAALLLDRQTKEIMLQNEAIRTAEILGERAEATQRLVDEYALLILQREGELIALAEENETFVAAIQGKTVCEANSLALRSIAGKELS